MSNPLSQIKRKKEIEACALQLQKLSLKPENRYCFDCNRTNPKWVSVNLGCWICLRCSGYHRHLGSHISFIKSISLDVWNYKLLNKFTKLGGNKQAKKIYGNKKIDNKMNEYNILDFITDKYVNKSFANTKHKSKKSKKQLQNTTEKRQLRRGNKTAKAKVKTNKKEINIVPDLMGFDELQNFQFLSDLSVAQTNNKNVNVVQPQPKLDKATILSKYNNNNWIEFSSSPIKITRNNFNYNLENNNLIVNNNINITVNNNSNINNNVMVNNGNSNNSVVKNNAKVEQKSMDFDLLYMNNSIVNKNANGCGNVKVNNSKINSIKSEQKGMEFDFLNSGNKNVNFNINTNVNNNVVMDAGLNNNNNNAKVNKRVKVNNNLKINKNVKVNNGNKISEKKKEFNPFDYINDLCSNNNSYYVYNGDVSKNI